MPGQSIAAMAAHGFLEAQSRHLGEDVTVTVLDPGVNLPECINPRAFIPEHSRIRPGRVTVGVLCDSEQAKTRYLQANITVIGSYIVSATLLRPGVVIGEQDIEVRKGELNRLPGSTITRKEDAINQVAKFQIKPGTTLLAQHLRQPRAIDRGDTVTVESVGQGFTVTRRGEALEPGAIGNQIRVRLAKNQAVNALVIAPGKVRVSH